MGKQFFMVCAEGQGAPTYKHENEQGKKRVAFLMDNCDAVEDLRDRIIDVQVTRIRELSPEIAIIEQ